MCVGIRRKGNINTPLELAILNQVDRFNLAIDVIDRVPKLADTGAHTEGVAEGADHRSRQLRPRERDRSEGDPGVEVAGLIRFEGCGLEQRSPAEAGPSLTFIGTA